jgi:hypothetical protein
LNDLDPSLEAHASPHALIRAHLRHGWIGLLSFVLLGIGLEGLHAFKSSLYLGVGQDTRRLMWTLAHAHGIGLSLVQLGFAATLFACGREFAATVRGAGRLLDAATVLIPLGFFLGGVVTYEGDPGLGILLVPLGALALVAAISRIAWRLLRAPCD